MGRAAALLVIDVQVGMFHPSDPVHDGTGLLHRIGFVIRRAREAGVPIFYIQHDGPAGSLLEPGTPGWAIHPAVAPAAGEVVIRKQNPDSFLGTTLQEALVRRNISHLVLTGIQTEVCVDTTCRRAKGLGYDVALVEDGHSTWDSKGLRAKEIIAHHNRVLGEWFATRTTAGACVFHDGPPRGSLV